jgi:hypothetical protein
MIQKEHIENFLRINGVPLSASDEEVRVALSSAKWASEDIDDGIATLHGLPTKHATPSSHVGHQLFRSDNRVAPETLSALLGVNIAPRDMHVPAGVAYKRHNAEEQSLGLGLIAIGLSIVLAFAVGALMMYLSGVGPFYSPLVEDFRF